MLYRKFREYLSIEIDTCLCLRINEGAVALETKLTKSGVQAYDPKLTEVRLLVAAVVEGVLAGMDKRLLCKALLGGTAMTEALGTLKNVPTALC